jgi:hypothetical protein
MGLDTRQSEPSVCSIGKKYVNEKAAVSLLGMCRCVVLRIETSYVLER